MRRFPKHRHSERAAWRSGWWAYRDREFADAVRIFEQAALPQVTHGICGACHRQMRALLDGGVGGPG